MHKLKCLLLAAAALLCIATVRAQAAQATVTWTDNADNETDFRVERFTGTGTSTSAFVEIGQVPAAPGVGTTVTYTDTTISAGTTYSYRIKAHNTGGYSAYSNIATGSTLPAPPAAPSGTTIKSQTPVATMQIGNGAAYSQFTYSAFPGKPYNNGPYKNLPSGAYIVAVYALN